MRYAEQFEEIENLVNKKRQNYSDEKEPWDYFDESLFIAMLRVKTLRLQFAKTNEAKLDSLRDLVVYALEYWRRLNLGDLFDE